MTLNSQSLFVLGAVLKLKFDSGFRLDAIERMLKNPNAYQSPVCRLVISQ